MRLLHAGLRDVALRAQHRRASGPRARRSRTSSPAICAAAPATARSWTPARPTRREPADDSDDRGAASHDRARRRGPGWFAPRDARRAGGAAGRASRSADRRRRHRCRALGDQGPRRISARSSSSATSPICKRIEEDADGLTIGAGVRYSEAKDALARLHPDLGELVRRIGGLQVRNAGTIGGNIANGSPIGDMPPALIALGAELVLRQGRRTPHHAARRLLPVLRQAGPAAGRVRRERPHPAPRPRHADPHRQALQALRQRHLRAVRRLRASGSRTASSPRPGSPSAAWPAFPRARRPARRR